MTKNIDVDVGLCVRKGVQNVLEDCPEQQYRRRRWTLCVKECPKCVRRLPWSKISTSTLDFVCERVFKCVRGLSWSEMSTSTSDFVCGRIALTRNVDVDVGLCV